ncbi:MAG: septum formation family protein, partial [Ornithinimicrobium sp.]
VTGAAYPGQDVFWEADEVCYSEFAAYTGEAFEESTFTYAVFGPSRASWAEGDRDIACAIVPFRMGSLEGSARRG